MQITGIERGYLNEQFRLFHTRDQTDLHVDWHYHTFDKLVFFLSGHAEYSVESQTYALRPGDLLTIGRGQLHRVHVQNDAPYERIILYLNSGYLASLAADEGGLAVCFDRARRLGSSMLRLSDSDRAVLATMLQKLERSLHDNARYAYTLSHALLTELMIFICRASENPGTQLPISYTDDKIAQALTYIQSHLGENLSCDTLAAHLYMSRSSFQHRFRAATGYTPHAYIRLKRLLRASELLTEGQPAIKAGRLCGYTDHSAFCHAFTQQFGMSPSRFCPHNDLENSSKAKE